MVTYTAYDQQTKMATVAAFPSLALALAQAARDANDDAVIPFAITTPVRHINRERLTHMIQIWHHVSPLLPKRCA